MPKERYIPTEEEQELLDDIKARGWSHFYSQPTRQAFAYTTQDSINSAQPGFITEVYQHAASLAESLKLVVAAIDTKAYKVRGGVQKTIQIPHNYFDKR